MGLLDDVIKSDPQSFQDVYRIKPAVEDDRPAIEQLRLQQEALAKQNSVTTEKPTIFTTKNIVIGILAVVVLAGILKLLKVF